MKKFGYIYLSTSLIDGMLYVGKRQKPFFDSNYYGGGINQRKWLRKYGKENFKIEIIQWCYSRDELSNAEKYLEAFYRDKYGDEKMLNIATGGISGNKFIHNPNREVYKNKLREAIYKQDRHGSRHPFYGKHHTDNAKEKISKAQLGKTMSEESRHKISVSKLGHEVDSKTREKISNTLSGRKLNKLHKSNISKGLLNLYEKHPEIKEKISIAVSGEKNPFYGKTHTKENRKKISNKRKEYFIRMHKHFDNILYLLIQEKPEVKNYKISEKLRLIMNIAEELKKQNM